MLASKPQSRQVAQGKYIAVLILGTIEGDGVGILVGETGFVGDDNRRGVAVGPGGQP
jgi:hypothetical protein